MAFLWQLFLHLSCTKTFNLKTPFVVYITVYIMCNSSKDFTQGSQMESCVVFFNLLLCTRTVMVARNEWNVCEWDVLCVQAVQLQYIVCCLQLCMLVFSLCFVQSGSVFLLNQGCHSGSVPHNAPVDKLIGGKQVASSVLDTSFINIYSFINGRAIFLSKQVGPNFGCHSNMTISTQLLIHYQQV